MGLMELTDLTPLDQAVSHFAKGGFVALMDHPEREGEADLLASCYRQSLYLAEAQGLSSIAFPAISCGIYGYPLNEAVAVAVQTVREWQHQARSLRVVHFVPFDARAEAAYRAALTT